MFRFVCLWEILISSNINNVIVIDVIMKKVVLEYFFVDFWCDCFNFVIFVSIFCINGIVKLCGYV